jgi:hypothetical protein
MQYLNSTNAKMDKSTRGILYRNSSQACQLVRKNTIPSRSKEHCRTRLLCPLGTFRVSGGLLELLCDEDRRTLEKAFDEAYRGNYAISRKREKQGIRNEAPMFVRVVEC